RSHDDGEVVDNLKTGGGFFRERVIKSTWHGRFIFKLKNSRRAIGAIQISGWIPLVTCAAECRHADVGCLVGTNNNQVIEISDDGNADWQNGGLTDAIVVQKYARQNF